MLNIYFMYHISFAFGLRPGSLERNPNIKRETKNITTEYTKIFRVNITYTKYKINTTIPNIKMYIGK